MYRFCNLSARKKDPPKRKIRKPLKRIIEIVNAISIIAAAVHIINPIRKIKSRAEHMHLVRGINFLSLIPLASCDRNKVANRLAKEMDILVARFVVKILVEFFMLRAWFVSWKK